MNLSLQHFLSDEAAENENLDIISCGYTLFHGLQNLG
jgi:hypothetical protein